MKARIYKPSQTAMQSGTAKTKEWVLEYVSSSDRSPEPLMGWVQSADTMEQVRIKFDCVEKAKAYAQDRGMDYTLTPEQSKKIKPRNYGDNFRYFPPEEDA